MAKPNPHRLNREQMHAIIDQGESVMLPNGRIVVRKEDLPGEAEIALMTRDPARAAVAEQSLREQIATLQRSLDTTAEAREDEAEAPEEAPAGPDPKEADARARTEAEARAKQRAELLSGGHPPADRPLVPPEAAAEAAKPGSAPAPARSGTGVPESPFPAPEDKGKGKGK